MNINEDVKTGINKIIKNTYDEVFDELKLVETEPNGHHFFWYDKNGEQIFERNYWGNFWIYDCDIFFYLKNIATNYLSISKDEFDETLISYLNDKYENVFGGRPIKLVGNEDCLEGE